MKNNYIIGGVVVILAITAFMIGARKSGEPKNLVSEVGSSTIAVSGLYKLDTEKSVIRWRGEYINGIGEEGVVTLSQGNLFLNQGAMTQGNFDIDMESIKDRSGNTMLENYLKSAEFFNVDEYPTASFVFKKAEFPIENWQETGRYIIAGDMTVRGVTVPISLPVTISVVDGELHAYSSFAINRTEWGVNYNSPSVFSDLGERAIRDAVLIELDLVAEKTSP